MFLSKAQYALSSKDTWCRVDGAFQMDVFYDVIVDLFEKYPDNEWVVDTLSWWNDYIFIKLSNVADVASQAGLR